MPDSAGPQKAPPYPWIAKQLKEGKVVPFLGASASMYHSDSLSPPALCPPSATALARELANLAQFPDPPPADEELARVASYFALESIGRDGLDQALRDKFSPRFEPNGLHAFLARVAKKSPMIIITTNYDDMIEQAFKDEKTPYQLIVTMLKHEDGSAEVRYRPKEGGLRKVDPNEDLSLKDVSIIYKMHGSIRPQPEEDSYLITHSSPLRL